MPSPPRSITSDERGREDMLDINFSESRKATTASSSVSPSIGEVINDVIALDNAWCQHLFELDNLRKDFNKLTKEIARLKIVPIQVNRHVAYSDGMRVVEPAKTAVQHPLSDGLLFQELDRPNGQPCLETKEFNLVRNMLIAVVEERYKDAAQWRDKLMQLRSKKKNWA